MGFCHLSMLSYLLRLECQNKFRIDTQSRWASDNPPLRDIASNNRDRVDNFQRVWNPLTSPTRQSFHMIHNMPFNNTPLIPFLVHHRNKRMKRLGTFHAIFL